MQSTWTEQASKRGGARIFEYDFLRVVAMVFVVAVHALGAIDITHPGSLFFQRVMRATLYTCNGLFFMLSGYFALAPSRKSYGAYYTEKIGSIGIPMLCIYLLRTVYERLYLHMDDYPLGEAYLRNLFSDFHGYEYWFLFVLVSMLLVAPVLAKGFAHFSRRDHLVLLSILLLHNTLKTVVEQLDVVYFYHSTFTDWFFYFYLGHALPKVLPEKKHQRWFVIAGPFFLAATVALSYLGITEYIYDLSPVYTVWTIATFFAVCGIGRRVRSKAVQRVFTGVARHSFTVYLTHVMILTPIFAFYQAPVMQSGLLSIPLYLLLVLVIILLSLALAFLLDHTLLRLLRAVYSAAVRAVSRALRPEQAKGESHHAL